jgi:PhzF family phenazine biosynthesis protein
MFQIDAFTREVFHGNPAAVCPLEAWLDDATLQAIAAENNLSETAFFVPDGSGFHLRWFTPRYEVNLCGHATLAAAFVIFKFIDPVKESIDFHTRSGILRVTREVNLLTLDFPLLKPVVCAEVPEQLPSGLGKDPLEVLAVETDDPNYFAVFATEEEIRAIKPDFNLLEQLAPYGVAVTAPGQGSDFVSRYFAPSYGISEDPVTGSIHCSLTPYWSGRLGASRLHARQVSARGGDLFCELQGDRVYISGHAACFLEGQISL